MAVYKVPQDVEADDKLIGFLSMKQFIFVVVAVVLSFIAFRLATVSVFLVAPFVPPIAVFAILGLYQRKDQPAEVYLLAMLGFYLKPHRRIWSQDGVLETLNITALKKVSIQYSDNLSQIEVKSRLNRLSTLMDTRGWAIKNAQFQTNIVAPSADSPGDRLINPAVVASAQPSEIHASDDILDVANNPAAQNFNTMVKQIARDAHDSALAHMHSGDATPISAPVYSPGPTGIHQKVITPVSDQSYQQNDPSFPPVPTATSGTPNLPAASTMTPPTSDAILELANRRDDSLSVETIAKEAERLQSLDSDETIRLH